MPLCCHRLGLSPVCTQLEGPAHRFPGRHPKPGTWPQARVFLPGVRGLTQMLGTA